MKQQIMTSLEEKVDLRHTALIVVDVQNDFCADGGVFHKLGCDVTAVQEMVVRLAGFLEQARSTRTLLVFVQGTYDDVYLSPVTVERRMARNENVPLCISGSWGWEFYQISPLPSEPVVRKHRYSAFVNTDLELILRSRGIKTLVICGVATNVCIESTVRDGYMRDYYVVLLEDCTANYDIDLHKTTLRNVDKYFGQVCGSADVIKAWKRTGHLEPRSPS